MLKEQIAQDLQEQILKGKISVGSHLPSLRTITDDYDVSLTTALAAYEILEDLGFLEKKLKSKPLARLPEQFLIPRPEWSLPRPERSLVQNLDLIDWVYSASREPGMSPFGLGLPSPHLYPAAALKSSINKALTKNYEHLFRYLFVPGHPELLRELAKFLKSDIGPVTADEIILTDGCLEGINQCLEAITQPGDTVAIESPCYFGTIQALQRRNIKVIELPTHPCDGLDVGHLEAVLKKERPKLLIATARVQNPIGFDVPEENIRAILDLVEKYDVPLLEDDIYGPLDENPGKRKTFKSMDKSGHVLYCSSFSKTLAPGLRLGWIIPGKFFEKIKRQKLSSNSSTNSFAQITMLEFLKKGDIRNHFSDTRTKIAHQRQQYQQYLAINLPPGMKISRPNGGYMLWIEGPQNFDSVAFFEEGLKQKISITPGPVFSASMNYKNSFRINAGFPLTGDVSKHLERLCQKLKSKI